MRTVWIVLALGALIIGHADTASARPHRASQLPGSNGGCDLCHIFPGGPRTPVGRQVNDNLVGGNASWARIFDLDADGDGFTNGEELGDEGGMWAVGDPSPAGRSDPNDEFGFPAPVGQPPVAQAFSATIDEDEVFSGRLVFNDPDGGSVTRVRFIERPTLGTVRFTDRATGEFTYTPDPEVSGTERFTWRVFDGSNLSEIVEGVITIRPVDDPPVFNPPLEDRSAREGSLVTFTVRALDVEDGELEVTPGGMPEGATFEEGRFSWSPTFEQAGEHTVTFAARDSGGQALNGSVTINVRENNQPPRVGQLMSPAGVREGDTVTLAVEASDVDGDTLTFTWTFDDGGEPVSGTGLSSIERVFPQDGRVLIQLEVTDGIEVVNRQAVAEVSNVAPMVSAGEDQTVAVGEEVMLVGSFVDPGALDTHTITWDFGDRSPTVEGEAVVTHAYNAPGSFVATFTVTDGRSQVSDVARITVGGPGADMPDAGVPDAGGMECTPGETLVCLCETGAIGQATCGGDSQPGACACNTGGGGGGGGCQTPAHTPSTPAPAWPWALLLGMVAAILPALRRR